jgi:hypothetical protein
MQGAIRKCRERREQKCRVRRIQRYRVSVIRNSHHPGYEIRRRLFWHCLRIDDIYHDDQDINRTTHGCLVVTWPLLSGSAFNGHPTSTNSQPTQRNAHSDPDLEFISTITLVSITLSFFTVLYTIFPTSTPLVNSIKSNFAYT